MKRLLISVATLLVLQACKFEVKTSPDKTEADNVITATTPSGETKTLNGITIEAKGVKVAQAYLHFEDGSLVPAANAININQKVILKLVIDKGWKEEKGKVSLGASEKMETNTGQVLLDEKDLFSNVPELNAADANFITLSAVITKLDKLYDYFVVSFKVWDKKSKAEITGNYKLYLKQ